MPAAASCLALARLVPTSLRTATQTHSSGAFCPSSLEVGRCSNPHSPKMAGVGAQTPLCKSNPLHVESFPSDLPEFCCLQAPSWSSLRVSSAFLLRQPKPFPVSIIAASPKPLPPPSFFLSQSCLLFTSVCFGFENFLTLNLTLPHLKDVDRLLLFTYNGMFGKKNVTVTDGETPGNIKD